MLRYVKESKGENVVNEVGAITREECKVKSVRVVKSEIKGKSYNGKPPVIVATLENREQVTEGLKSTKALKDCQTYKRVFINGDVDP